ncbi:DUF3263 domain-containing protein [Rhodococcus sp. 05-2254-6]|uniref:DUF3263 domain-containing protein n=1 Tax=Nocardiaceae TaxID=85025 RepID=UPI0009E8221D|nr:DUF3263 domain-containing protein [Rhodococcus sp. 05-2254-6]OZE87853.1 DUF3263 domain-containing protein [Rhodococcus sp. 15-649-2-2]OZE94098.1 DUF3263 domain-containing protein [Rhodococcus sp. 15-2388-1-1a]
MLLKSDRAILDFALKWLPWGGGSDEDIMVGFGLSAVQFYSRLQAFLDSGARPQDLNETKVIELYRLCNSHLAQVRRLRK